MRSPRALAVKDVPLPRARGYSATGLDELPLSQLYFEPEITNPSAYLLHGSVNWHREPTINYPANHLFHYLDHLITNTRVHFSPLLSFSSGGSWEPILSKIYDIDIIAFSSKLLEDIRKQGEKSSLEAEALSRLKLAVTDALAFAAKLPVLKAKAVVSVADDGELAVDWGKRPNRAIVTFVGDGTFAYALLRNGRFAPGQQDEPVASAKLPAELTEYLANIAA